MSKPTILVNLKRCTGCWTCSLACKVGNHVPEEEWWQFVRTLGDGSGIDEPGGEWPNVHMSWMPIWTKECVLCKGRTSQGEEPYCVYNCSSKALIYGDRDDPESAVSKAIISLEDRSFRLFQLPAFEGTRPEVIYADA